MVFLRKAGTVIVAICIILWWLGACPHVAPPAEAVALRAQAQDVLQADVPVDGASAPNRQSSIDNRQSDADDLIARADALERQHAKAGSFIGRIGRGVEPLFEPLGYDWQLSVGVLSSFLAREVFVSTMAVVLTGSEEDAAEDDSVRDQIVHATRSDGSPLFTISTAASLLVFYVLAMQCLPTLAVTRRETGSWKWALLQLGYMTAVAYAAALLTYSALRMSGVT
jgi:ferrous iron transport protein B